jgi:hypothetical protein
LRSKGKKAGRVTAETARRITGISTPIGGIQWSDPGPSEREHVRHFLLGLEDRRALYNPMQLEVRGDVEHSLHRLRDDCTQALRKLDENSFAIAAIRAIREACRRFHDDAQLEFRLFYHGDGRFEGMAGFFTALGALRATVGYQIALLAAHYNLDVESELASILPQLPEEAD